MISWQVLKYIWNHPSNRHRKIRAVGESVYWQVEKRVTKRSRDLPVFGKMRLRCYPNSRGAAMMIYSGGWYDYDDMDFVRRYLRPGDCVLDVGANIGVYTLLAASVIGPTGKIVAYEPNAESFDRLLENIQINGIQEQVDARRAAVGESRGSVKFHKKQDVSNRIAHANETANEPDAFEEVPCVVLDEECKDIPFVLGKIDIEGAEMMAFRGMTQLLRAGNPPVWLLELKDRLLRPFGTSAREVADLLGSQGYQLAVYEADDRQLKLLDDPRNFDGNALAIHQSSMEMVRDRLK